MANTYSWDCKTVDTYPTHSELTDVVYNVHWRLTGVDESGEHQASVIGTQIVPVENIDASSFVAFENLTNEIVVGWVQVALGPERVAEFLSAVDAQISEKMTPSTILRTIG